MSRAELLEQSKKLTNKELAPIVSGQIDAFLEYYWKNFLSQTTEDPLALSLARQLSAIPFNPNSLTRFNINIRTDPSLSIIGGYESEANHRLLSVAAAALPAYAEIAKLELTVIDPLEKLARIPLLQNLLRNLPILRPVTLASITSILGDREHPLTIYFNDQEAIDKVASFFEDIKKHTGS